VNARKSLSRLLPLSLTLGLLAMGCDEAKPAESKGAAPAKAETKPEAKAEPAAEAKAEPAEAEPAADAKAEPAGEAKAEPAEDAKAEPAGDAKAEPTADKPPKAADEAPKAGGKPKADEAPKEEAKPAAAGNGKELYMKKCKSCHGVSGAADTKIAKKHDIGSWTVAGWKSKWTMSKVKDIVANGKAGTKMKAFKGKLTPEEIDAVSAYARGLGK
jgi:mono/diheme cytochrome c family protein